MAEDKLGSVAARRKRREELQAIFGRLGIDCSQPGFYDDPAFMEQERADSRFAETYAEWVLVRDRAPEYDAYVRETVPGLHP